MAEDKEGVLIKLLREATPFEIGLIAFLFLPPILLIWMTILTAITETRNQKLWIFFALSAIYAVMVGIMAFGRVKAEKRKKEEDERQRREAEERKIRNRQLIVRSLDHPAPVWRNLHWIELESWLDADETKRLLREMVQEEEIVRGENPDHPEWGHIFALRRRL